MTAHVKATPQDIYDFIVMFCDEHGYSPTTREISKGVGLSSQASVQRSVNKLKEEGRITLVNGQARTIRPTRSK